MKWVNVLIKDHPEDIWRADIQKATNEVRSRGKRQSMKPSTLTAADRTSLGETQDPSRLRRTASNEKLWSRQTVGKHGVGRAVRQAKAGGRFRDALEVNQSSP